MERAGGSCRLRGTGNGQLFVEKLRIELQQFLGFIVEQGVVFVLRLFRPGHQIPERRHNQLPAGTASDIRFLSLRRVPGTIKSSGLSILVYCFNSRFSA